VKVTLFDGKNPTSPALLERLRRRVARALRHTGRRVRAVRVWLSDINGRRGGIDKRCRIVARLAHAGPVVVEQRDGDYYRAVDGAALKLRHAVERRLARASARSGSDAA
jgi:putative sigma-54 modulation protein